MWGRVSSLSIFFYILINCQSLIRGQAEDVFGTQEKQILDTILNDRYYDKSFRPGRSNVTGPTRVTVNLEIHRIKSLNDLNMELDMSFTMTQEWIDERLRFSHLNANIPKIHSPYLAVPKIWVPDTYFTNQVSVDRESSIGPNVHVQISSDGKVRHSSRISGKFFCPLEFQQFPHDTQTCSIGLTSYGYDNSDIDFEWSNVTSAVSFDEEALHLPKFEIEEVELGNGNCSSVSDEKSCVQTDIKFQREFNHYLIQIYIPCVMMVIISFLSLFLDPIRMATPRTVICISVLVLAVVQVSAINSSLPPVSYTKGIDIWTGVTLTFLFLVLVEFVLVGCACRTKKATNPSVEDPIYEENVQLPTVLKQFNTKNNGVNHNASPENNELQGDFVYSNCARNIDIVARVAFPVLFIIFIVIYFLAYVEQLI